MTRFNRLCLAIMMSSVTVSCASWQTTKINTQLATSHCNQQNVYTYTEEEIPRPLHLVALDPLLKSKITRSSLNIAHAIGVLELLTKYVHLKEEQHLTMDVAQRIHLLEIKQEIEHQVSMSSLVISAVSSELDCEDERTSQVANFLKSKEDGLESKLTMGAIIVGASGAIATGATYRNDNLSNGIGVGTGIAEASLGLLMLFNNRKTDFYHDRNALKDIWEGPKVSQNFPPFVWYYLTTKDNLGDQKISVREEIIEKWKSFGQIDEEEVNPALIKLYFGKGGRYSTEQLKNRSDMYDQLESQINLIKQDLMALSIELGKI